MCEKLALGDFVAVGFRGSRQGGSTKLRMPSVLPVGKEQGVRERVDMITEIVGSVREGPIRLRRGVDHETVASRRLPCVDNGHFGRSGRSVVTPRIRRGSSGEVEAELVAGFARVPHDSIHLAISRHIWVEILSLKRRAEGPCRGETEDVASRADIVEEQFLEFVQDLGEQVVKERRSLLCGFGGVVEVHLPKGSAAIGRRV